MATETDLSRLQVEIFNRAKLALAGMGEAAARPKAWEIAIDAATLYQTAIASGTPPGVALQSANSQADTQIAETQKTNNITPTVAPGTLTEGNGLVTGQDIESALKPYRDIIAGGKPYSEILDQTKPQIVAGKVTPSTVTAPKLAPAAQQAPTTVQATTLDTTQADQSRGIQVGALDALQQTAAGRGAGGEVAVARLKQSLQRGAEVASGVVHQARGSERKGLRLAAALQQGQGAVEAANQIETLNAQDRQAAQAQVGTQAATIRAGDTDIAGKKADLDSRRTTLQAQLDDARNRNDTAAINDFTKKIADLDLDAQKFSAAQTQSADTGNAERDVSVQDKNIGRGIEVADLKIRASKAVQDAAQGILTESTRQENIKMAKAQLVLAQKQFDLADNEAKRKAAQENKDFWLKAIVGLAGVAMKVAAAHGGLVEEPTELLVGEAGPELIIPIKGKITTALREALALDAKPFNSAKAPKLKDVLELLKAAMRPEKADTQIKDPDKVAEAFAVSNARARKERR